MNFKLTITLLFVLAFGGRPDKLMLGLTAAMLIVVAVQHFYLSPQVTDLGRRIADLPPKHPLNATFWMFHGIYSGVEIVKLLIGAGLAVRFSFRPKTDTDHFAKKYAKEQAAAKTRG